MIFFGATGQTALETLLGRDIPTLSLEKKKQDRRGREIKE